MIERLGLRRVGLRRHCWVDGPPAGPGSHPGPHPGLVLDWRRDGAGQWHAWVVYVLAGDEPAVVQAWVPAGSLRPAR